MADDDLRAQLVETIIDWAEIYPLASWPGLGLPQADQELLRPVAGRLAAYWAADIADRILAVRDQELERLRAQLAEHATEYNRELVQLRAAKDLAESTRHTAELTRAHIRAERDALKAAVERVNEAIKYPHSSSGMIRRYVYAADVRAALDPASGHEEDR